MRDNTDHFFTAQCSADAPALRGVTPEEIAVMRELRWWTAEQIEAAVQTGERFFPEDIAARIRRCNPENSSPE
jgi:hypothetical protein